MATAERGLGSWLSATLDLLLSVLGFILVWYPMVSLGNAVLGFPVSTSTSNLLVGVLALGGSYPIVAGDWSLGQLGEYIFVLIASAIGWGLIGMIAILASGVSFSGSNPAPQAAVWVAAYLTAYIVVCKSQRSVFR
ncbi:hypothetical protein SAMN05192561_105121 [Halopenitus malekzadehii]|uniref:Uncharacterized protein n=1 Tax=Halopenitus malekzadehii TaxID=1267564 RepID=A0A1H6IX24_9EURY|nr:hypothetical protein [Halopenitus malekzadehii]SEH53948.1 hypothetical protein SAMN05192561_105121 [Halopenitus malekzadehii]